MIYPKGVPGKHHQNLKENGAMKSVARKTNKLGSCLQEIEKVDIMQDLSAMALGPPKAIQ